MNRMTQNRISERGDVSILQLQKGSERYVFFWTENDMAEETELLERFQRYASNPELSFSWYDCANMSNRVREMRACK